MSSFLLGSLLNTYYRSGPMIAAGCTKNKTQALPCPPPRSSWAGRGTPTGDREADKLRNQSRVPGAQAGGEAPETNHEAEETFPREKRRAQLARQRGQRGMCRAHKGVLGSCSRGAGEGSLSCPPLCPGPGTGSTVWRWPPCQTPLTPRPKQLESPTGKYSFFFQMFLKRRKPRVGKC